MSNLVWFDESGDYGTAEDFPTEHRCPGCEGALIQTWEDRMGRWYRCLRCAKKWSKYDIVNGPCGRIVGVK